MNKQQLKEKILEYGRKCAESEAAFIQARFDEYKQIHEEVHELIYEIINFIDNTEKL